MGAVAGAGALAGCESIPFIGGDSSVGQFTNWVPEPTTLQSQTETVLFTVRSPSQINSNRQSFDPQTYRRYRTSYRTGIQWSSVNMRLSLWNGLIQVSTGSFSASDIDTELTTEANGDGSGQVYAEETTEGNYSIYVSDQYDDAENADRAYAVKGDTVINARRIGNPNDGGQTAIETAQAVIETGQGDNRATAEDDAFNSLANEMGGTFATGTTFEDAIGSDDASVARGIFDGTVAQGTSHTVNGSETERKDVYVFESQDDVDTDDLEEYVERNDTSGPWRLARNTSVNQNGNVGIVSATFDTFDINP